MFGITETTVHVSAHTVTPADAVTGSRTVGRALLGWSLSVRDGGGRLLPPGAAGELHVGGAGVADRYLGRPELTAERFVLDPMVSQRVYRSGDRGRMRPDGSFDHLGRLDNQVKVRGHRIELDEIREVLLSATGIAAWPSSSAKTTRRTRARGASTPTSPPSARPTSRRSTPTPGACSRTTWSPPRSPGWTPSPSPSTASWTSRLPISRTTAVAEPVAATAQQDDIGETVLGIWRTLLKQDVPPESNFFTLGGNSLLVIRALALMRE